MTLKAFAHFRATHTLCLAHSNSGMTRVGHFEGLSRNRKPCSDVVYVTGWLRILRLTAQGSPNCPVGPP